MNVHINQIIWNIFKIIISIQSNIDINIIELNSKYPTVRYKYN